jgi:hypothetical protein
MQFGHFESAEGVGPKGLGSLAQASAWVTHNKCVLRCRGKGKARPRRYIVWSR